MALNFPSDPGALNPANEWIDDNGVLWIYDAVTNSWTAQGGGGGTDDGPFNFRGDHDFTQSTLPNPAPESGDLFVHDGGTGTIDAVYTGISGEIADGQLVLFDGAEYNMLSGSVPGYPDTGDGDGATLDERYVKIVGDDDNQQIIQGEAGLKTAGLLESAGGVTVSNGNLSATILSPNSTQILRFEVDSPTSKNSDGESVGANFRNRLEDIENDADYVGLYNTLVGGSTDTTGTVTLFRVRGSNGSAPTAAASVVGYDCDNLYNNNAAGEVVGFNAASTVNAGSSAAGTKIGFKSNLSNSGTGEKYNFYAAGAAPNFLQGFTYIGGTIARNTLELWKSTLTEEQLEQFEAGTLVAPANVANPGDGEYARSWYYDQQDAQTQAALDAGTREYPEHLAAATFTDTFADGDGAKIVLQSTGLGHFKNGVKVSGGSDAGINTGICSENPDIMRVATYGRTIIRVNSWTDPDNNRELDQISFGRGELADRNYAFSFKASPLNKYTDPNNGRVLSALMGLNCVIEDEDDEVTGLSVEFEANGTPTALDHLKYFTCKAPSVDISGVADSEIKCYQAPNFVDRAKTTYGFYSDNSAGTYDNYNFYAAGNAPNYFAGPVMASAFQDLDGNPVRDSAAVETFQELQVAVENATNFGELKAAMLVALEDYKNA